MSDTTEKPNIARAWIDLTLVTASPLHIGSAEDEELAPQDAKGARNTVQLLKGEDNRAVIPGSSLRGCLRAIYRRAFGDASQLFGCGGDDESLRSGRLQVRSALSSEPWSTESIGQKLSGHARDPVTHAVQDTMFYRREVVRAGVSFEVHLIVKNTSLDELSELCEVLKILPQAGLGGAKRSGQGQFEALQFGCDIQVRTMRHYDIKKWLKAGSDKQLQALLKPLKKLKPMPIDQDFGTKWSLSLYPQSAFHMGSGQTKEIDGHPTALPREHVDGRAIVPGTALKGALRAIARRLLMSLLADIEGDRLTSSDAASKVDVIVSLLFGSTESAGCLWVDDFISEHSPVEAQRHFNAIDRFTGGAADGKLYSLKVLYCDRLRGDLLWRPLASVQGSAEERAILHLLGAVFTEAQHLIYLGGVAGRGLGEMRLVGEIDTIKTELSRHSEGGQALMAMLGVTLNSSSRRLNASDFLVQCDSPAGSVAPKAAEHSNNKDHIVHPYQFVNADEVSSQRQDYAQLASSWHSARHDVFLPDRFTGRIICRIRLQSPLMVGAKQNPGNDSTIVESYTDPITGELAVPGSSIRGCISSVAESISGSAMRVLEDQLLTQRAHHKQPLKRIGRITNTGQAWEISEVETERVATAPLGSDTYTQWHEQRADELGQFKHGTHSLNIIRRGSKALSLLAGDSCPVDILAEMLRQRVLARRKEQATDKHIFPLIPVEYMESFDYELARSKHKQAKQIWRDDFRKWIDGKLVYFKVESQRVTLLSFSEIWRVPYKIKKTHLAFLDQKLPWGSAGRPDRLLSPAEALFGVVEERAKGAPSEEHHAALLASRVRFSDALVDPSADLEQYDQTVLRELSSPKPPSPHMYFKKEQPARALGHKHYVSQDKPRWRLCTGLSAEEQKKKLKRCMSGQPIKAENANGDRALFYFHVNVHNLSKEELGLLLWSLSPDGWGEDKGKGFRHKLGMGKPLGLGQLDIDVLGLWQHNPLAQLCRKQSDLDCALLFKSEAVAELPPRYQREINTPASLNKNTMPDSTYVLDRALAELRAIGRVSSTEGSTVDYPRHRTSNATKVDDEGFKWFEINKGLDIPHHHHTPDLEKTRGLAAFPVLGPPASTKKPGE